MPKTETDTDATGRTKTYCAQAFLHKDRVFRVGEELQLYATPEELETLIDLGHASREPVATAAPVYAVTRLSYHPHTAGIFFDPGDRLDGVVPAAVLEARIASGEASYTKPEVTR